MPVRSEKYQINQTEREIPEELSIPAEMIENIQNKLLIKSIQQRMFNIEQCYFNPQTLTIENYNQLRNTPGEHWKSRMYILFCDTYLPHYWILDIWKSPSQDPNEIPHTVYLQLISFRAKMFVKSTLTHFLSYQNASINVYD